MARLAIPLVTLAALAGCGAPKDPDRATQHIIDSRMLRVGVSDNPPWVRLAGGEPDGIEPALVRGFAASLGARVVWTRGSESVLAKKLKAKDLDLVAAGLDSKAPWKKELAVSQAYVRDEDGRRHVLLAAPGENQLLLRLDRFLVAAKPRLQAEIGA